MTIEIHVPVLGESVSEATVGKWFKSVGDFVAVDEPICELETDKVALEVNATASGALSEICAKEGDSVGIGALLAKIDETAKGKPAAPAAVAQNKTAAQTASPTALGTPEIKGGIRASAAKVAADNAVDLSLIVGSGPDGIVTKGDVLSFLEHGSSMPSSSTQTTTSIHQETMPQEEVVPMTRLRRTIAKRLKDAQNTAAMLTTYNEVDMSAIIALRNQYKDMFEKKHGSKLGFMSFFVKACVQALKEVPEVNAQVRDDSIVYKNYYHVGVAASTPAGLVVPVVRNCQDLSFSEIEKEIVRLGGRARDGKLSMDEMQGGTFTLSNGGIFGSLLSSPILNAPQSGILGMHAIKERVMVEKGQMVIRPMMYLALSYDHRVVDGKGAVTFLVRVKECLEDPQRLVLDL